MKTFIKESDFYNFVEGNFDLYNIIFNDIDDYFIINYLRISTVLDDKEELKGVNLCYGITREIMIII